MRVRNRHDAATTLAPGVPGGRPQGLRERLKPYRNRIAIAFIIIGGIAFAAGWNPPTNTVHSFSEASDYNARRESGCTNSGDGCHGFDEKRRDFNDYHPETACRTCHEYTGVGCIPCHGPSQRECTGCHDGTMPGASDCVRLSDPYPAGHYRESLHTAMGTDMGQVMRAAADGEAQATCGDCHSRDLMTAHTGVRRDAATEHEASVGCAECHNDVQSGALEQVKTDWPLHRCDDCHGEKVNAPMHAIDFAPSSVEGSGTAGCGDVGIGCHSGNQLHALHPSAPKTCSGTAADGEPGCHDIGTQAPRPAETACGGDGACHPAYVNTEYSHKNDAEAHSANDGRQGASTLTDRLSGVTITCAVCHSMDIGMEHTRPNSALSGDACLGCHNASEQTAAVVKASWPERETTEACAACHGDDIHSGMDGAHVSAQLDRETGKPAEGSCVRAGCHATADVRSLHAAKGCTLSGCHSRTGRISGSAPMSCGGPEGTQGACHAPPPEDTCTLPAPGVESVAWRPTHAELAPTPVDTARPETSEPSAAPEPESTPTVGIDEPTGASEEPTHSAGSDDTPADEGSEPKEPDIVDEAPSAEAHPGNDGTIGNNATCLTCHTVGSDEPTDKSEGTTETQGGE